jgi:hypothetical protein
MLEVEDTQYSIHDIIIYVSFTDYIKDTLLAVVNKNIKIKVSRI